VRLAKIYDSPQILCTPFPGALNPLATESLSNNR